MRVSASLFWNIDKTRGVGGSGSIHAMGGWRAFTFHVLTRAVCGGSFLFFLLFASHGAGSDRGVYYTMGDWRELDITLRSYVRL